MAVDSMIAGQTDHPQVVRTPKHKDRTEPEGLPPPKSDFPIKIPAGRYRSAVVQIHRVACFGGSHKREKGSPNRLVVVHRLIDEGDFFGIELKQYFNVDYRRFPLTCKYLRNWMIATGRRPSRRDRLSPKVFKGKVFLVEVETTRRLYDRGSLKGKPLPEALQYSIVSEIVVVEAGA